MGLGSFSPLGVCWVSWGLIQDGARLLSSGLKPNNSLPENLRLVWDYGDILGSPLAAMAGVQHWIKGAMQPG